MDLKKILFGCLLMAFMGGLLGFIVFELFKSIPQIEFIGIDHGSGEVFSGSFHFTHKR